MKTPKGVPLAFLALDPALGLDRPPALGVPNRTSSNQFVPIRVATIPRDSFLELFGLAWCGSVLFGPKNLHPRTGSSGSEHWNPCHWGRSFL